MERKICINTNIYMFYESFNRVILTRFINFTYGPTLELSSELKYIDTSVLTLISNKSYYLDYFI